MAYKYSMRSKTGRVVDFESDTMLTRDEARQRAAEVAYQQDMQQQQLEQTAEESRGVGGTLRDTALGLGAGVLDPIGEDLIGGGLTLLGADELGEAARETFGGDAERLREMQTPQIQARQQLAQQRMQEVEGEGFIPEATTAVSEYLSNPSLLFQLGTEQLPQLIPIARAGRLTRGVASRTLKDATEQTLNRAGLGGAASAAGALQGSSVGMETYDRVYEQGVEEGLSEADASEQALRAAQQDALQSGALTVGTTFAIPGAGTVERAVLGRAAADAGQQAARRFPTLRGAGRGAAGEATQEGIEEGGGAYISNLSAIEAGEDIDPMTGVGSQTGIGSLLGAGFGGITGAVQGRRNERVRQENELLRQAQEQQEAQQRAERQARGEMDQQDLLGFEPGALPEVDGPPAPEPPSSPEFELEPTANLETTERQGELDLDQPAPTQPARVPTGQRGFDFRSDQEQLGAVERELAEFDQTYGGLSRNEQRQVRQGLQQERDRLQNRRILDPRPAEESAQTFQEGQPDLLGFYQPEPETTGAVEAEADTRADAQKRIDAGRRRRQGETFGGPQRELELGRPVEPVTLTEERLAEFGLPALARRPDRVRANFKKIARRFEGLDLTDPQQRQQAQEQLEDVENRYSGNWVGPFSERMRGELQATEQQAQAVQAERERIGLEREQAPRRAIQENVDFAVERGLQEEQDARAQTEQEQRRAALRQQLIDRQAERVREQATGRIPLTEDWKRAARTQLSQRQEEAQMRERGLDEMAAQEAADFELDMQYVDERTPQLEPDQKVAASDFVQQYTEAQAINDPQLTQAVEQEARSQLGSQQWGRLKSGLSSQRRAQQRRLEQEQAGETQPEQPDLLAQPEPETTPEPEPAAEPVQGELFSGNETVEGAFDQQTQVIDAERRRLRESPTFDATTTSDRQDAQVSEQTAQVGQTPVIGTGQVSGGFNVAVNFDENQGVAVPQGEIVDSNSNPTTNPDREANHLPENQSDLDVSPLSKWTQTLSDAQRQEFSSKVEQSYPKLTPRTSRFVYELPTPSGVVFNSTLFLNTRQFYNKTKDFLYHRVLAHEAGHLTHSKNAAELDALVSNNPAEIEAELRNVSTALYGNFDQQRVALQDHQYLSSPNELLAELNAYRMMYPEWAQTYAPRLSEFLESKQSSLTNGNSEFPHPESGWSNSDWQNAEITFSFNSDGGPADMVVESNGKTLQQGLSGFAAPKMAKRPKSRARFLARSFGEVNDSTGEVNPVAANKIESAIRDEFLPEAAQDAERAADTAERAAERDGDGRPSRRAVRGEQEPTADEQPTEPSVDVDGQRDQSRAAPEPESREERGVGRDSVPPRRREAGAEPSDVTLDEELPAVAVPLQRAFNAPTEANTNALLNQANQDGVLSDEQLEGFRQKIQQGEQARAKAIMHVYNEVRDYEYFTANPSVALSMSRQVKPIRQAAGLTRAADQETVDREVDQDIGPIDDDTDIVFSRAPYQDKKLATVQEVEAEIKPILKNVPKEFTVNVVQSRTDLPSELSVPNNVRGVYQNGTIYIIADATSAFDAQTVLAHELVGHAGMEGILGRPAFNNLVNQINNLKETNPRIREILENIRREYTNNQGEYQLDANQEAREIIAHIAEAKPQYLTDSGVRRVWNNIVRRVRNALTKLGFINPSDNLLDQLVYEAALHAQGGGSATRTGRVFLRPETMAAHTMQRAWDKGYRGFDVQEAGRHLRGVADGSISVLDRTAEDVFNEPTDDSYLDTPAFSRQETAEAPVNDGYDAVVSDVAPRDVEKPNRLRQLVETLRGPRRLFDTFRVKMVDASSTYEDKMRGEWVNGLRNAQGEINPMVSYVQSLRSEGLAAMVLREGSLIWNEATNLWTAERKKGNPSLTDAFHDVNLLGQRIGQKAAMDRAHAAFMARRELAIEEANRKFQRDADQARARGNTKLANKIEEKIVDMFPGQNADFYAQRMAENRKRMELFSTYPELESAFNNFTKFKNNLLDAMVESGVLSQEKATDFKNNIDYVPFNRILETSQGEDVGGYEINTTGLMQTGTFRQLQGSAKDINNIMDNMAKLSIWMTQAAVRNQAAKQLIRGMRKVDGVEAEYQNTNEVPAADRPHLVSFRDNGKVRFFKLKDPLDAYAWRGTESLNMPALRLLSAPADWLRKGITLSPDFILSQLQQDTFRVYSFAGVKNPARGAARVASNWWRIRDDLRQGRFGDAGMNRYGILGQYDYMPEQTRRDVEADVTGQDIGRLGRVVRFGERNAEASDLAQRKAVFDQTLADTNGDEVMAFWRASEIINFNRRGVSPVASVLRQIIPFQNAYMQGMNVLGKSLAGRGISQAERTQAFRIFYSTVGKLATLSAMYAVMMSDDEDYLNQPSHIRSRYFNIPTGDGLPGLKMAMPADLAFLAKSLPETAVLQIMRDDQDSEKVARELRDAFVTAISGPNITPQTVKPFLEVATNYSFFRSGPIVGMGEQMREVEDQYRDSTSELAKLIGQSLGYSPLKVDHLLRGYFGTLGSTALTMTDIPYEIATGEKTPRRELADYPVGRTLFSRTSGTGFKEDFYNLRDDVRSAVTSLNLRQKQGDMEGAQELVEDSRRLLALRRQVNQVENTIEKSNRRIRQITDSDLSPDEKRERIDRERDFQARLASQVRRMRSFAYDQ